MHTVVSQILVKVSDELTFSPIDKFSLLLASSVKSRNYCRDFGEKFTNYSMKTENIIITNTSLKLKKI